MKQEIEAIIRLLRFYYRKFMVIDDEFNTGFFELAFALEDLLSVKKEPKTLGQSGKSEPHLVPSISKDESPVERKLRPPEDFPDSRPSKSEAFKTHFRIYKFDGAFWRGDGVGKFFV